MGLFGEISYQAISVINPIGICHVSVSQKHRNMQVVNGNFLNKMRNTIFKALFLRS